MEKVKIRITSPDRKEGLKIESFLEKSFEVISRSGLHITENQLIRTLGQAKDIKSLMVVENRTGVISMIGRELFPEAKINTFNLDLHHYKKLVRNIKQNEYEDIETACLPFLDTSTKLDLVCMQLVRDMEKEIFFDLLQQIHGVLKKDGKLFLSYDCKDKTVLDQVSKVFGSYSLLINEKHARCLVSKKKQDLKKKRDFSATFEMTLPSGLSASLTTLPGVFSHRRVDQGAQAMAEIVEAKDGDTILDMGCGCGSIGISVMKTIENGSLHLIDASARAVYISEQNCINNDISSYSVSLTDTGIDEENTYSLYLGNPPYFSDFKISELFIDTAYSCLQRGGRAYIVAKTADRHYEYMEKIFGNARMVSRRGYDVICSVK